MWSEGAERDIGDILDFISRDSEQAARRLKERIDQAILPALQHPYMFRQGRVPGTREIVAHPNYVVVYRVTLEQIEIVGVVHARRDYP